IRALDTFDAYSIGGIVNEVKQETKVKGRKLYMPIRIAATLRMHGPQLAETIELMGRDQVLKNVDLVTGQL
ncbi:glutamate--tRNA ligase, partial [Lacticaseibacillus paracasei]